MGKFLRNQDGNVAVMAALAMTVVVGLSGVAILSGQGNWAQTQLQASVDSAALAGTALPATATERERIATAKKIFELNIEKSGLAESPNFVITSHPSFSAAKTKVSGSAKGKAGAR